MTEGIAVSDARAGEAGDLEFVRALRLFIGPNADSYLQHFMRALAGIGMSLAGTATASDFRARLIGGSASDASIASPRSAAAIPACDAGQTRQLLGDLVGQYGERKGRNFSNLRLQDARGFSPTKARTSDTAWKASSRSPGVTRSISPFNPRRRRRDEFKSGC